MSITINYYFNHSDDLLELTNNINLALGCSLSPYEGDPKDLFCRFLGMEFSLSKHNLENDLGCNFEDYKYELGFRVPVPDGDLRAIQLPAISLIAFILYQRMKITGMLVYEDQIMLADYEERKKNADNDAELYDSVSKQFVSFPAHFEALQKRVQS